MDTLHSYLRNNKDRKIIFCSIAAPPSYLHTQLDQITPTLPSIYSSADTKMPLPNILKRLLPRKSKHVRKFDQLHEEQSLLHPSNSMQSSPEDTKSSPLIIHKSKSFKLLRTCTCIATERCSCNRPQPNISAISVPRWDWNNAQCQLWLYKLLSSERFSFSEEKSSMIARMWLKDGEALYAMSRLEWTTFADLGLHGQRIWYHLLFTRRYSQRFVWLGYRSHIRYECEDCSDAKDAKTYWGLQKSPFLIHAEGETRCRTPCMKWLCLSDQNIISTIEASDDKDCWCLGGLYTSQGCSNCMWFIYGDWKPPW